MKRESEKKPHKDLKQYHVTAIVEDTLPMLRDSLKAGVKVRGKAGEQLVITAGTDLPGPDALTAVTKERLLNRK